MALPYLATDADLGGDWADWTRAILASVAEPPPASPPILSVPGPLAVVAAFLAASTNRRLVVDDQLKSLAGTSAVVCALADATDRLLARILSEPVPATGPDGDGAPSLIVARDVPATSRLVARIVRAHHRTARSRSVSIRHFSPDDAGTDFAQLTLTDGVPSAQRDRFTGAVLPEVYRLPADVTVVRTHGSEACANGSDGVVLCGRQQDGVSDGSAPGGLSCGFGRGCARGPVQVPLSTLRSDVVMLGTCNGLRLHDSLNQPSFSFALSALDGETVTYVSSMMTSSGGDLASIAFPAALASGYSVGAATSFANAVLQWSGVERSAYICLGDSTLSVRRPVVRGSAAPILDRFPTVVQFGPSHIAECRVRDPKLVAALMRRDVILVARGVGREEPIFAFPCPGTGSNPPDELRVVVFGFPHAPGEVEMTLVEGGRLKSAAIESLHALGRWAALWRAIELDRMEPELYRELRDGEDQALDAIASSLAVLRMGSGIAVKRLESQLHFSKALVKTARSSAVENLVPRLGGSFWLSNVFAPEQVVKAIQKVRCPACGGDGVMRQVEHAITGAEAARSIGVCARCGIFSDLSDNDKVSSISIQAPDSVCAGATFAIEVVVEMSDEAYVEVHPRLCAHGHAVPAPVPAEWSGELSSGSTIGRFEFALPPDVLPHRHYVKVIVSTDREVGFACRPIFVTPAREPAVRAPKGRSELPVRSR